VEQWNKVTDHSLRTLRSGVSAAAARVEVPAVGEATLMGKVVQFRVRSCAVGCTGSCSAVWYASSLPAVLSQSRSQRIVAEIVHAPRGSGWYGSATVTSTAPLQFLILLVGSWISRRRGEAIEFLQAENRVLRYRAVQDGSRR
jgi:hypothetical protein